MQTLTVQLGERSYDITIGAGLLDRAGEMLRAVCPRAQALYIVTDSTVAPLYLPRLNQALDRAGYGALGYYVVPAGESSKSPALLARLWEDMAAFGLTRTDAVLALGGGVVGDLAGFAAATILRGVDFVQIPTTLLSQVDASVGGKVAVDLQAGKNLAGTFYQPRAVLMDPTLLDTLDDRTFADGMAEVIKYGAIFDADFFSFLEQRPSRQEVMADIDAILSTCCSWKRKVVAEDERDTGARMVLNFGHTLGHAYELAGRYQVWTHGQAVAAGMVKAARLGHRLGVTPGDAAPRIAALLRPFDLPVQIPCTPQQYAAAIGLDKKGAGGQITLVLLQTLGRAILYPLDKSALLEMMQ